MSIACPYCDERHEVAMTFADIRVYSCPRYPYPGTPTFIATAWLPDGDDQAATSASAPSGNGSGSSSPG